MVAADISLPYSSITLAQDFYRSQFYGQGYAKDYANLYLYLYLYSSFCGIGARGAIHCS
ncbi:MAG: hypothetical protein ACQZ3N_00575 [cyanobacterium endosymbiont of Rhopalodia yunnanensis]